MMIKNDDDNLMIEKLLKWSLYVLIMMLCGVYGIIFLVIVLMLLYFLVGYYVFMYRNDLLFIVFGMVIISLVVV